MAYSNILLIGLLASLATCEPPVQGYQPPYNYHAANPPQNSGYLPPNSGYNAPSNSYNAPSSSYNAPSHSYNAPSHSNNAPSLNYNAPSPSYSPPISSYDAPSSSYGGHSNDYSSGSTGYDTSGSGYDASYDHHHHDEHSHDNEVPKSYEFGYTVKDAQSGNDYGRQETSDGNTVRGEYRVQLPDGRTQIVTYHADWKTGFHADVRYEGEARYPEPQRQGGYNYNAPDFSGSLTGFQGSKYGSSGY